MDLGAALNRVSIGCGRDRHILVLLTMQLGQHIHILGQHVCILGRGIILLFSRVAGPRRAKFVVFAGI